MDRCRSDAGFARNFCPLRFVFTSRAPSGRRFPPVPQQETNGVTRFGIFEADFRAGELRRHGARIRLQDQPFQVLALLLAKRGELVTREELQSKLWPADTFVDFEHGLNAAVKRLRDALGDSADNPRFIETLARRGYRFIAPVNDPAVAPKELAQSPQSVQPSQPRQAVSHTRRYWQVALATSLVLLFGIFGGWQAGHRSAASLRFSERRLTANPENEPIMSAALSPDGRYLAFTDRTGLFLRVVGSGETHSVAVPDPGKARFVSWFPDGNHVLTTRSATPGGQPSLWDISVFGGTPRKLIDAAENGMVSPDGSQLAFLRGEYGRQEIWLAQPDGSNAHKLLGEPGDNISAFAWSPDGRHIAYTSSRLLRWLEEFDASLFVRDLATQTTNRLLTSARLRGALVWTRDGRLIYSYAELPPNQNDSNLWAVSLDAQGYRTVGQAQRLTSGPDGKMCASISADGKHLSYLRWAESPVVYVTQVDRAGGWLAPLRQLSLIERRNLPFSWTPDSQSVIFTSDRDGIFHLFKQAPDQPAPDLLVGGDQSVTAARLNPDSSEILFVRNPDLGDHQALVRLMRVPLSGGTPQLVLAEPGINNFQCSRAPSAVCVLSQISSDGLDFFTFDPVTGKKTPLTRIESAAWYLQNWSLSPDGSTLAMAKKTHVPGPADIHLFSIADGKDRTLTLQNWSGISSLDWAADGRTIWVTASSSSGMQTLLNVDLRGRAKPVLQEPEKDLGWAIPSPDGRHLAIWEASGNSNAWLLEGF
jgi:Tol biopolymer transport system component/DNA-binding winged helix-turn-helix (wHTH) protein